MNNKLAITIKEKPPPGSNAKKDPCRKRMAVGVVLAFSGMHPGLAVLSLRRVVAVGPCRRFGSYSAAGVSSVMPSSARTSGARSVSVASSKDASEPVAVSKTTM